MSKLLALAQVVPFNGSIDTALGHRNLVLIYILVWLVQLGYGAFVLHSWRASGRRQKLD